MTKSVLEFDEIAADDALIEAVRSGATATDLPSDDPAPSLLLALRDGADEPVEESPAATTGGLGAVVRHRRVFASGVAACILAVAGVGTAVAGDPTAAFSFMFREGVDLGSRFGSPAGEDHALAPVGGGDRLRPLGGENSSPVRQGSAAAPWSDDRGTREPFGYEEHSQTWEDRGSDHLDSFADGDRSTVDTDGDGKLTPDDSWPTGSPEGDERPTPEQQTYGPDSDDSEDDTEETGPTEEYGPTYTDPTESSPTPTESSPTESSPTPTQTSPTEPSPTPTESSPTSPTPTSPSPSSPTETSPTTGEPTSSTAPTSPTQPPSSPTPTETSPTP